MSFPCSVQESKEAADFPFNPSPSCRSECQSNTSAATRKEQKEEEEEEEGQGGAAAKTLLVWLDVGRKSVGE